MGQGGSASVWCQNVADLAIDHVTVAADTETKKPPVGANPEIRSRDHSFS